MQKDSPTFLSWDSVILSGENKKQFWVPPGLAHGFLVLSDNADFEYKCTNTYDPDDEYTLIRNNQKIGIEWPSKYPILSEKDSKDLSLDQIIEII